MPINKELIQRARKSNAAYKEDLRKAEEEEKARLATREREKEEREQPEKKLLRPTLRSGRRSGRRRCKICRGKSRPRRHLSRSRTTFRRQLMPKVKR